MATFQTLQTWIGYNATCCNKLKTLPHALPHALTYIFSEVYVVLGYVQRITMPYHHHFFLNIKIYFFINLTVICGNVLQITPNHSNLK